MVSTSSLALRCRRRLEGQILSRLRKRSIVSCATSTKMMTIIIVTTLLWGGGHGWNNGWSHMKVHHKQQSSLSLPFQRQKRQCWSHANDPFHDQHEIVVDCESETNEFEKLPKTHHQLKRRSFLTTCSVASTILVPLMVDPDKSVAETRQPLSRSELVVGESLKDLRLGKGQWSSTFATEGSVIRSSRSLLPAYFCTYAACFLIQFDQGVASWWNALALQYSLLPKDQRNYQKNQAFAGFARSLQVALDTYVCPTNNRYHQQEQRCRQLVTLFVDRYPSPQAKRHIGLLFAMLPTNLQPDLTPLARRTVSRMGTTTSSTTSTSMANVPINFHNAISNNHVPLLPLPYECARMANTTYFTIDPPIALVDGKPLMNQKQHGDDIITNEWDLPMRAVLTPFGPISTSPLTREQPKYSLDIYALFGLSGATGCALTHAIVIPLDVVKTKMQTDANLEGGNLLTSAQRIVQLEGPQGLLLGAEATIAGYFWYGLSVYPCYTFFKRFMALSLLPPAEAMVHGNDIALIAGALAAVVASIGLTPIEAARIREVADPPTYKPLGLWGTLSVIATEDKRLGWKALYSGLPSLLTRQVIFGSVKFLAFERACDAIYATWPILGAATWTSLTVSLIAGGLSGTVSSIVSHPADAVLTFVAKNSKSGSVGVLEGCRIMVEREGIGSLFRGLGSRCVWAGSIIAGQFLLYDIFRTYFGVNTGDLSQVYQVVIPPGHM